MIPVAVAKRETLTVAESHSRHPGFKSLAATGFGSKGRGMAEFSKPC